ncbi:MAG: YbhB/YbcL family Raf kinase inhibitor-like protein [Anaerolineae bacterium]
MSAVRLLLGILTALGLMALSAGCARTPAPTSAVPAASLPLSSPAFAHGQPVPQRFTCDGEDVSPPLHWGEPPAGTRSFVLIMDDPDAPAGTWTHWVLFNIPAEVRSLEEAVPALEVLTNGARHGKNSWGRLGYGGPCPPAGTHRYFFRLFALDVSLDLAPGAAKRDVQTALQGHILAQGELMGTYARR